MRTFDMISAKKTLVLLIVFVLGCLSGLRGQDYSGTYYIASERTNGGNYSGSIVSNRYYMVPAQDPQQNPPIDVYFDAENWVRIQSLDELHNGDQVVIAARYDNDASHYYAMPAYPSGQPVGASFSSTTLSGVERLSSTITNAIGTYRWTVSMNGNAITLTNDNGKTLGWTTGTNFVGVSSTNNDTWNIELATAGNNAMVPNHTGFVITNPAANNERGVALQNDNNTYEFGPFAVSNNNNSGYNFYLDLFVRPATYTKPYITTYTTNQTANSIWTVAKTADNYYTIQHVQSGKYLVYAQVYTGTDEQIRKVVHLEATDSPGENAKFAIGTISGSTDPDAQRSIRPKSLTGGNNDNVFLNVFRANQPNYYGTGGNPDTYGYSVGLIGVYSINGGNSYSNWHFEEVTVPAPPTITYNNLTHRITITHTNTSSTSGYRIYWTNDDTTPTTSSTEYTPGTTVAPNSPAGPCTLQAIVVDNDTHLPSAPGTLQLQQVATPTHSLVDNHIVLSPTAPDTDATLYFNINSAPSHESYLYESESPIGESYYGTSLVGQNLRFIAVKSDMVHSQVANCTYQKAATPVIAATEDNHIAITCATSDVTLFYTTNGDDPVLVWDDTNNIYTAGTNTTQYNPANPLDSSHSGETIKAVAWKSDLFLSDVAEEVVNFSCPAPTFDIDEDTGEVTLACSMSDVTMYYTTNGADPDPEHTGQGWPTQVYDTSNPFTLTAAATVKAIATKSGCPNSSIASHPFEQAAAPVLTFTNQLTITATDATVKYCLNDTGDWTVYNNASPLTPTSEGVTLGTTTLALKTVETGKVPYILTPFVLDQVVTPVIAENGNNAVGITCATSGAAIQFGTGGSQPSVDYTGPLGRSSYSGSYWTGLTSVSGLYISAQATKANMFQSAIGAATVRLYTLVPTVITNAAGLVVITIDDPQGPSQPAPNFYQIRYTTTGTTPTANSILYTGPFTPDGAAIIKAVGIRGTYVSDVSASLSFTQVMAPIVMDNGDNHISISTPELGATIYYTSDGSTPDPNQVGEDPEHPGTYYPTKLYTGPLDYTYSGLTIKAIAVNPPMINSTVTTAVITLRYPEPSITINPANGEISLAGNGSSHEVFFYTTDGTDPDVTITVSGSDTTYVAGTGTTQYAAPFSIWVPSAPYSPTAKTVKAVTARGRWDISDIASRAFYQTEKCEVAPVVINGETKIEITSGTVGSTIFYTTDGNTMPTCTYDATTHEFTAGTNSTKYTAPLASSYSSSPIFALAVREDMIPDTIKALPPHLKCKKPIITRDGDILQITSGGFPDDVSIYFTYKKNAGTNEPADPTTSSTLYNPAKIYVMHDDKYPNTPNGDTIFLADAFLNSGEAWNATITFKAIAVKSGFETSLVSQKTLAYNLQHTNDDWYLIQSDGDLGIFVNLVNHDGAGYNYRLCADVSAEGLPNITNNFTGVLEGSAHISGEYYIISDLDHPIFNKLVDGKVRNIMLKNVHISQSGSVGAICCGASGAARVYNCGILPTNPANTEPSTLASTDGQCGSLVGFLDGTARVINCFSYANITGGSEKAGIVGYNNYASKSGDIKTMVMNCMFFGDIASGGSIYPIYGGSKISNEDSYKLNNYNYFLFEAPFSKNAIITEYNCALAAEERYLKRFEFYRYLVNSTREVAAWYVTGSTADAHTKMAKWVLDKKIAPYPILKVQDSYTPGAYTTGRGLYPSVINYDPDSTFNPVTGEKVSRSSVTTRNQGGKIQSMGTNGMLSITISQSNTTAGGQTAPSGATVTITSRTLPIIDKDTAQYNFNYGKVQLPYYNEVGTKNYNDQKVVTGWKITHIEGGTPGTFVAADQWGGYNFADRNCTNKDLYSVSGQVFSQGAYFNVPYGVTAITIEPNWAKCYYVCDQYWDSYGYETNKGVTDFGKHYDNNTTQTINGWSNQRVFNTLAAAYDRLVSVAGLVDNSSIYDYAIVLIGNVHQKGSFKDSSKPVTIMSADLDFDNEPDYSLIINTGKQEKICPTRFDFINIPNVAMAHKKTSTTAMGIFGNIKPKGWFETTNTAVLRFSQYEYDSENKTRTEPLILLGGLIDMITSNNGYENCALHTSYIHVGDNVWFRQFNNGCHMDRSLTPTPRRPISVTGGEYEEFYLSGYLRPDAPDYLDDPGGGKDAECYISGGKFGEVAGAAYERIVGDVTWDINHADIESFYGGGINEYRPVLGNITTTIKDSYVGLFVAGPKFGNLCKQGETYTIKTVTGTNNNATVHESTLTIDSDRLVTTTATDCVFGRFFGGGNGGTAIAKERSYNKFGTVNYDWNDKTENAYITPVFTGVDGSGASISSGSNYRRGKFRDNYGISVNYDYRHFEGSSTNTVAYLFINYASLSLAQTNDVTSTLTRCTVNFDFYGGGNLGKVDGDATSELTDCTIYGNVFGGGYSATVDSVKVFPSGTAGRFAPIPYYNTTTGVFEKGGYPTPVYYQWTNDHGSTTNTLVDENGKHWIYTNTPMNDMGKVTGHAKVTVKGNTYVEGLIDGQPEGGVFGGGDEASVGSSEVIIQTAMEATSHPINNVYGGGNIAITEGNSQVTITTGLIGQMENGLVVTGTGNVYGGGRGRGFVVGENPNDPAVYAKVRDYGRVMGNTTVIINGGKIRYNVYGGGKLGSVGTLEASGNIEAGTGNTSVIIDGEEVEVGPLDGSGLNAYVFGGGKGVESDYSNTYKSFADVANASVTMTKGVVKGSLFGGPADGHVLGNASVTLSGGTLGTDGTTSWDGNIFGGGRNFLHTNPAAGRVGGNVTVIMEGGTMKGSVFGGGRLGNVGVDINGDMVADASASDTVGHIFVHIKNGTVGNTDIIDNTANYSDTELSYIGNVYGGSKGLVGDLNYGQLKETKVIIEGSLEGTKVLGSVHGGSEFGPVRGASGDTDKGNTWVNIEGGTIGAIKYSSNSVVHVNGGNVFGGGKGSTDYQYAGLVYRNATVNISGGHVLYNVYGGGELASVGSSGDLDTGLATVNVTGGQVGPAPKVDGGYNIPIGLNGRDGYVFGGGKGIGVDPTNAYKNMADVNKTDVTVRMGDWDPEHNKYNRIWGSIFGGAEDGHVLGDASVKFESGLIGTKGTTSYDGNIFGGGRNYEKMNYTAGRVGGNIYVEMTGGTMLGSIFGGGRLGLTGVDVNGKPIEGDDHGLVTVQVKGGTVGNVELIRDWTASSMGDVYGGGKGSMEPLFAPHPNASPLLVSLVKNTIVEISQEHDDVPTRIYGSVFGGGEVANVGGFTWVEGDVLVNGRYEVSNIQLIPGTGTTKVTVTGGTIGAVRNEMNATLVGGTGADKYDLRYNFDVGHVFGGGEGVVGNPDDYPILDPYYNNKHLIDLMATVGSTEVTIGGSAWVKGSVYGGAENGHVLGDTYVKIEGGLIGAGCGTSVDLRYGDEQFIDPTAEGFDPGTPGWSLKECACWPFSGSFDPFDPVDVSHGINPTDGKTFFGNVFGGGSGYYPYIKYNTETEKDETHWNRDSGQVRGNTKVEITGGHILTSVYGGNETSDVGEMDHDEGKYLSGGKAEVIMSGGTIGVPRTREEIRNHPITCYLFGSGKGDPRVYFNTWTNVRTTEVTLTGGIIYGSALGGGEDAHVLEDVKFNASDNIKIGTVGNSSYDGNIFGGGRGFSPEALTAGTVGGNIEVNISGGTMLGSVYGGGRNGSVGTHLVDVTNSNYGKMQHDVLDDPNTPETHGHITVNITGGTIGNDYEQGESTVGGNVFGACLGTTEGDIWKRLGRAKQTEVTIEGNPFIKGNVYGGSAKGSVVIDTITGENNTITRLDGGNTHVTIRGGTIGRWIRGTSPSTHVHRGGKVFGAGKGYDTGDENAPDYLMAGITQRNATVDIEGGHIYYNIYGGGEIASLGLYTEESKTVGDQEIVYHRSVAGTGLATVNFSGGELGPEQDVSGNDGLNGVDGYIFGGGEGIVHPELNEADYLARYKWCADVNNTEVTVSGGRIWGSVFGGSEDGHVIDDVKVTFEDGTIGTHGITGYDGNIFSGGRNYQDFHNSTGRVGGNITTRMTGGSLLGSMFGGGRQGSVGVDEYGVMKKDVIENGTTTEYGSINVAISGGIVGHDRLHGDPLIGGNVYGASKGKAGPKYVSQAMAKDVTVVITGDAQIVGSVMGGGENAHVLGMTHITVGDAEVDDVSHTGSDVLIGITGLSGQDGNVYGGGRGDGTYIDDHGVEQHSATAGIVGTSTHVEINNGRVQGSVYGGGRFASLGSENALLYYDPRQAYNQNNIYVQAYGSEVYHPTDFGRTNVIVRGNAIIGSMLVDDNGHVFGGGRGESDPAFNNFTNVHETFVYIMENAKVNGSVYGGGEDGHVVDYTNPNGYSDFAEIDAQMNGDTHVFIDGNNVEIGNAASVGNEKRGNVHGGGRGLNVYETQQGGVAWNPEAGRVDGNTHATLLHGTVWRFLFGGSEHSLVHGRKVANVEGGIVNMDVYGGSKLLDDSWSHPGIKTVNIHGGTVNNVFGCGYNLIDGNPDLYDPEHPQYENRFDPTSYVNISGGHVVRSVHAAGQAGTVYGSTLVYFGENAIYNAPNYFNQYNVDKDDLYSEKNYLRDMTGGSGSSYSGNAHQVSKLLVEADVYGGSAYYGVIGGDLNWKNFSTKGYSNIYIDGTGYNMATDTTDQNYMIIKGSLYGSGTNCESAEMGRNIFVREYGNRNTSTEPGQTGWFTGSTRPMGSIQRVGNLVIDHSNFTFTGQSAIGNPSYPELVAVYKVDSCFYVANGSGITLGQGDVIAEMDSIRRVYSGHIKSDDEDVYSDIFAHRLDWEWIGIRQESLIANRLFYYNTGIQAGVPSPEEEFMLTYDAENVLVFNTASNNKTSMLHVRYTGRPVDEHNQPILVNGNPMPVKQYYGELTGFFRMISGLLPWGTKSFAEARPKLTPNNQDGLSQIYPVANNGDGGFMSYQVQYNFYRNKTPIGNDGGLPQTCTNQYPYTNVMELTTKGDREEYRIWVVGDFKGHRWYVDGTRGWGRDGCNAANNTTDGWGWGMFADRPKQTIKGIFTEGSYLYGSSTHRDFQWKDELVYNQDGSLDEEASKYKDVIYVVGPIDCDLASEYASLNPHPEEPLLLYRYPGGHKLSSSTNHDPDAVGQDNTDNVFDATVRPIAPASNPNTGATGTAGPGPNYHSMIKAGNTQTVALDNVMVDGLYNHVGLDNTYLSIPALFQMGNIDEPLVLTKSGSNLTVKGGTILQRGYNNHLATYYDAAPATPFDGITPMGGALFVHPDADVFVEGLVDIRDNWHKHTDDGAGNFTNITSNVFLPSFQKYLRISNALSESSHIGITSPVRNDEDSYTKNTFSPVAVGVRSGATGNVLNAVLDAQNAWENDVFTDDMDGFFGSGNPEPPIVSHTTYYNPGTIPHYEGGLIPNKTLFFGWTWSNVVRSKPAGYVKSGNTITISTKEGLAWLISRVNGLNNETKCSMADSTILLNTDVANLDQYVWVPVGSTSTSDDIETEQFAGTFDGQGHLVKGLTVAYIGLGDGRYQFADYGMFGRTNGATIDRTFLVDELIEPNSNGNMGGIIGVMKGAGSVLANSEAAVCIATSTQAETNGCGGLVGLLIDGEIRSSMAMADISANQGYVGGLVGGAYDPDLNLHSSKVRNSFANFSFTVPSIGGSPNTSVIVGGVVGNNVWADLNNCYSRVSGSSSFANAPLFGTVTGATSRAVTNCYGQETILNSTGVTQFDVNLNSNVDETGCGKYTDVIGSNNLGYMYSDNVVTLLGQSESCGTLTSRLNRQAWAMNRAVSPAVSDSLYANWARPALAEINDDYPVLLLKEFDGTDKYQGSFRSVGTYAGGRALQYGGPVRDGGDSHEVSEALARPLEKDDENNDIPDCLFIYGDVNTVSNPSVTQSKVSIYEHAAILNPGVLGVSGGSSKVGEYDNTYVGVSFDNSCGSAMSSPGINVGLVNVGGYALPRDWHMFSTPLSNAPLGFNYTIDGDDQNKPISGHTSFDTDPHYDATGFFCNPWKSGGADPNNASNYLSHEFEWLTAPGSEECTDRTVSGRQDNRYWMGADVDGYFPYYRGSLFSEVGSPSTPLESEVPNLFITNSTSSVNEYYVDGETQVNRYPYGMDFYSWYEPVYHWINFKRNGPNHWHSDEPHNHLDYTPETSTNWSPSLNVNETTLLSGKGYMAAIAKETLLQSHGTLNNGDQSISLSRSGTYFTGWNLVGNPYHAYLDFDKLAASNQSVLAEAQQSETKDGEPAYHAFYAIYDADGYGQDNGVYATSAAESAYRYYVVDGSEGGEYASQYLHPHQGFFVLTPEQEGGSKPSVGNLTFSTSMIVSRDELGAGDGLFLKGRPAYPLVNLYLTSDNGCRDVTVIEFNRPDWGGANKMKELRQGNGIVYGYYNGGEYSALFVKKGANRVPVRFEPNEDDFFTLHWNHANGEFTSMYLVDNMTGIQTDMLAFDSYTFEAHKYDYKSRFYIVFSLAEDYEESEHSFVFFDGSEWVVMGEGELDVIDVLGHVLKHTRCTDGLTRLNLSNVASGVYLMRLTQGKECKVQKIVITPYE